jgi:hypothetical protein
MSEHLILYSKIFNSKYDASRLKIKVRPCCIKEMVIVTVGVYLDWDGSL